MSRWAISACGAAVAVLAVVLFAATRGEAGREQRSLEQPETARDVILRGNTEPGTALRPTPVTSPALSHEPPPTEPALAKMVEEFARFDEELSGKLDIPPDWRPSPPANPPEPTLFPALPPNREPSSQLEDATKWFQGLPDLEPKSKTELTARRERMSKAGLELLRSECRSGVCLLSFVYSQRSSERLKARMKGRSTARRSPNWMSFTIVRPDGRVEGHVFMGSGSSHGGGK